MVINWYPGHMTKARRAMQEDLKLIDLLIEIVDARAPLASRNPDLSAMAKGKYRMIVLNKADLADEGMNRAFEEYFRENGYLTCRLDSRRTAEAKKVKPVILEACREKIEKDRKRGIKNRPVRAMVAGIPNVGKSTLINSLSGRSSAKTGNKPGVTRGNQWIKLDNTVELLDTPGILWPKFEDPAAAMKLAWLGSISDDVLESTELFLTLAAHLKEHYPEALYAYLKKENPEGKTPEELLREEAAARGCLLKGGDADTGRMADLFLTAFRAGKLGRITLEKPEG